MIAAVEEDEQWTFRELDQLHGVAKGTAFRAFKRLLGELAEGRDYFWLGAGTEGERIEALRRRRRIYPTSVNVVLLTDTGRRKVAAAITAPADPICGGEES
jgi:hypothetical protein